MEEVIFNQPTEPVIGLPPAGDLTSVEISQGYPDTCAIRSQEIIMRDFGIDVSQETLIAESIAHGWYNPNGGGTNSMDVGNLLELHGIGVEKIQDASIEDLVNNLAQGRRIIVGVDSGELWEGGVGEELEDLVLGEHADHALVVAGIDTTDPANPQVVLTDPGTGHVAKSYPLEQFMDAWTDSGCYMVVTDHPAPATAHGMANFDYAEGHIPSIGDMLYDAWRDLNAGNFTEPFYHSADVNSGNAMIDLDGDGHADLAFDSTATKAVVQVSSVINDVKNIVNHVENIFDGGSNSAIDSRHAISGPATVDYDGDGIPDAVLSPELSNTAMQVAAVIDDVKGLATDVGGVIETFTGNESMPDLGDSMPDLGA